MAEMSRRSTMRKEKTDRNGEKMVMNPGVNKMKGFTDESTVTVMNPDGSTKSKMKMKVSK